MAVSGARPLAHGWLTPDWETPPGVRAFVTTRQGGVSAPPFDTLDLGYGIGNGAMRDDPSAVDANRDRVQAHLPAAPVWLRQVHGTRVVAVGEGAAAGDPPVADAAVTRAAGVPLVVLVADCLPVLLASRDGGVIGAAHAGWRGLAAGVVERTLEAMACPAAQVVAWLGPSIGPDAFEVGDDVRDAFRGDADARCFRATQPGKWRADLPGLARLRLGAAGVAAVHGGRWCTVHDRARFYSYRRDGATGRMGAFIWRAADAAA